MPWGDFMQLLTDSVLAVLAAVGLASIFWLVLTPLLRPRCAADNTLALVAASGSAEDLEQSVRMLVRLRAEERVFSRIVILDGGLDEEARARANLLCRKYRGVELRETIGADI